MNAREAPPSQRWRWRRRPVVGRRPRVLLTATENHYVVTAARALVRSGFAVTAGASRRPALGHRSRYPDRAVWLPDPHDHPERHADAVGRLLRQEPHDVLIAGEEASLLALSGHRDRIDGLTVTGWPVPGIVERSLDKIEQLRWAEAAGIEMPPTVVAADEEAAAEAAGDFGYPVLLKPRRSQVATASGVRHQKSLSVASDAELRAALPLTGLPVLVQAPVAGRVFSYAGVVAGGELVARAFAHYERTWPARAGSASFAETLPEPPGLWVRVLRLLALAGHEGVFEVEFIGTGPHDLRFIDLNPRLYGSLTLAVTAGADLPTVWCRWLLGQSSPCSSAVAGVRYRWEEGEVRNVLEHLARRELRAAVEVARPRRRVANALFRLDDPGPFVAEWSDLIRHRLTAGRRSRGLTGPAAA